MRRTTIVAALSVVALPIALALSPGHRSILLRAEVLVLGACAQQAVVGLMSRAARAPTRTALDPVRPPRAPRPAPPSALAALDRRLRLANIHAGDAHHWIRPLVRAIAADRLVLHRGLDLDQPEDPRIARVLGPVAYPLTQATRRRPDDPFAPGISREDLEAIVAALEAI